MDTDFYKIYSANKEINQNTPIIIGENTWIGCRVSILKGCRIPAGSVIAAGSVVNKNFEQKNCIYGGVPAKILKENISWDM